MKWLSLLLMTCTAFALNAQENPVAYSVDGPVKYSPSSKGWFNFSPLKTGMPLSQTGRLKLKSGASVSLLYDEQYTTLSKKGKHAIATVLADYEQFQENPYAELLQERVEEASDPFFFYLDDEPGLAANTKPTKPIYESRESDGHGDADAALRPITTNGGKVAGESFFVSWAPKPGTKAPAKYRLQITNDQGKVLLEETTSEGSLTVSATEAGLKAGQFYRWQTTAADEVSVGTPLVTFEYTSESALEAVLSPLKADPSYQGAQPAAQLLLEAVTLEENGFQERAGLRYRAAMEQDPDHDLARALYKAFLWRQGL
ncbi:MAG: hypothetical protein RIC19_18975 [Phaeodactylibacter sp.]|uniref:hypothetical protein n=1 Tax=Phaeodactylibacter sp. TaxID=1940289 RepID=UPI0032ECAC34